MKIAMGAPGVVAVVKSVNQLADEIGWGRYQWRLFIVTGLCFVGRRGAAG